jgi:phosphate transport system permease protein
MSMLAADTPAGPPAAGRSVTGPPQASPPRVRHRRHGIGDAIFRGLTAGSAWIVLLAMGGIFFALASESWLSLRAFGLSFLWTSEWNPVTERFGAASMIFGTLVSTLIAMALAVPLSLAIGGFLADLAGPLVRRVVGTAIELLAAIPSIIYGMWGLFVFAPFMSAYIQPALQGALGFLPLFSGPPFGIGMLTAGIILALMILPFISAVVRDVLLMVPPVVKEAAFGMGSTHWEVARRVTIPYAVRGIVGATFLGLARAIGETMAVTFVIGNNHGIAASLFAPSATIPSTLANEFTEATTPLYLSALVELGLVLFMITFAIQLIAQQWLRRLAKSGGAAR